MVYASSRNYPLFPEKQLMLKARGILSRYAESLEGTDFTMTKGKDPEGLLSEMEALGKDTAVTEANALFLDKLAELLVDAKSAPADTASKIAALVRGAGEGALAGDYLKENNKKGFASNDDRLAFGAALWAFENIRDRVNSEGPAKFVLNHKSDTGAVTRAINAMIILKDKAAAADMLGKFGEIAGNSPQYAGLLKGAGMEFDDKTLKAAVGAYSGDMATVVEFNLTGKVEDKVIEGALGRLNPKVLGTAFEVAQYAVAYAVYGRFSYADTASALTLSKTRLGELSAGNSQPQSLVETFRVLELLSDEKLKIETRQKKSVLDQNLVAALLGAA